MSLRDADLGAFNEPALRLRVERGPASVTSRYRRLYTGARMYGYIYRTRPRRVWVGLTHNNALLYQSKNNGGKHHTCTKNLMTLTTIFQQCCDNVVIIICL